MRRKNSGPHLAGKIVRHAHPDGEISKLELWHDQPWFVANGKRQRARAKAARLARRKQRK